MSDHIQILEQRIAQLEAELKTVLVFDGFIIWLRLGKSRRRLWRFFAGQTIKIVLDAIGRGGKTIPIRICLLITY